MFSDGAKSLIVRKLLTVANGRLTLFQKINYTVYPARAMAKTLQMIGEKNGKEFLFQLGFDAGNDAADELIENLKLDTKGGQKTYKLFQELLEVIGFGKFRFIKYKPGSEKSILHVDNHPVLESAKEIYGTSSLVCNFYQGVYSAHAQKEFNIPNAHFEETQCICHGNQFCEWITGISKEELLKKD
ncbi:MAG: hypothetical protein ACLFP2_00855 [Candidatus Woesearchaeota archaeon]